MYPLLCIDVGSVCKQELGHIIVAMSGGDIEKCALARVAVMYELWYSSDESPDLVKITAAGQNHRRGHIAISCSICRANSFCADFYGVVLCVMHISHHSNTHYIVGVKVNKRMCVCVCVCVMHYLITSWGILLRYELLSHTTHTIHKQTCMETYIHMPYVNIHILYTIHMHTHIRTYTDVHTIQKSYTPHIHIQ